MPDKAKNKTKCETNLPPEADQLSPELQEKLKKNIARDKNRANILVCAWTVVKLKELGIDYDEWKAGGYRLSALGLTRVGAYVELRDFLFSAPLASIQEELSHFPE